MEQVRNELIEIIEGISGTSIKKLVKNATAKSLLKTLKENKNILIEQVLGVSEESKRFKIYDKNGIGYSMIIYNSSTDDIYDIYYEVEYL